jgi:quercetin dioxygenase-like cupin family protein
MAAAAPAGPPTPTLVVRTGETMSAQPIRVPGAPHEVVVSRATLAPGGVIPAHRHPWSRYAYVEAGRIRVTNLDTGAVRELGPGDVLVEPLDQWHEGRAVGDAPVRLVVTDHVPKGESNVVWR